MTRERNHPVDGSRSGMYESVDQYRAGLKAGNATRLAAGGGGGGSRSGCCLFTLLLLPILLPLAWLRGGAR